MSSELSKATTLAPSDSASQAPVAPNVGDAPPRKSGGKRKNPKAPKDPSAPPGAVDVNNAGANKTGKKSAVVSATVPVSGWGETDLHEFRRDIRPEFTTDANPYEDLCSQVYASMQAKLSNASKHVPRALFMYYCFQLWHLRTLHLHKGNANGLTSAEKHAYNVLSAGEEYMIPAPIAQYLANLGNFQQGGETYYYVRALADYTGEWKDGNVVKGWLPTSDGIRVNDGYTFWHYAQVPVPAVYTQAVQMEANNTLPNPAPRQTLDHIAPADGVGESSPTDNIIGWSNVDYHAHHSSWRSTYSNLGWSQTSLPRDTQSDFNISTSSMKWISERLSTVKDLKTHSSKQLLLSLQGNPLQAYYLGTSVPQSQAPADPARFNAGIKGTLHFELCLSSRFSMDPKMLTPTFSFGYRIERSLSFRRYVDNRPVFYTYSNFDPWIWTRQGSRRGPPDGWQAFRDATFSFGSQSYINVPRFGTHELNRSTALDVAVILGS